MKIFFVLTLLPVTLFFCGCKKDPSTGNVRTCNILGSEVFTASIDNQSWNACEYKVIYYKFTKQLSLAAIDNDSKTEIHFLISLDTITPLKTYPIGPNRSSGIEILKNISYANITDADLYYCDMDQPATGGTITITKLDTVTKQFSGTFTVNGYSSAAQKTIAIQNGSINNIQFETSAFTFPDHSYVSADINNTNWYGRDMQKSINFKIDQINQFLTIQVQGYYLDDINFLGLIGNGFIERDLTFQIPLALGTGTFQLYPLKLPFSNQTANSQKQLFSYTTHNANGICYPVSGTITILNMDLVNRNLDARFSTQTRDTTGNNINFANGKILIENWKPL